MSFQPDGASEVQIFTDAEQLATASADFIAQQARDAIAQRGQFHLVLTGGSTPKLCYQRLARMSLPWDKFYIYFGDERCVALRHAERNDLMAEETLLQQVTVPEQQIYRIPAELGAVVAANRYIEMIGTAPTFDLTLLGMGEDGHIASLFPGNAALDLKQPVVPVFDSPKPPPERVSLSLELINRSRNKLFIVAGAGKQPALTQIQHGELLPAAQVSHASWYLDQAASP